MATSELDFSELERLPRVCAKCGAKATDVREEEFTWTPQWAQFSIFLGLLPLYILVKLTQRRVKVPLPLCSLHRNEKWSIAQWVVVVGVAVVVLVMGVGLYIMTYGDKELGENLACGAVATAMLLAILGFFVCKTSFRATHIGDATITLDGVSEEFKKAVAARVPQVVLSGGTMLQTAKYFQRG
jgi:hypothetical protein